MCFAKASRLPRSLSVSEIGSAASTTAHKIHTIAYEASTSTIINQRAGTSWVVITTLASNCYGNKRCQRAE